MPYETVKPEMLRAFLKNMEQHVYQPIDEMKVTAWVTSEPVAYAGRESGIRLELKPGDRWGDLWDCAWFHFSGKVPAAGSGEKVVLLIDVNGELCLVDEEGSPVQGLTNINSEFDYSLGLPGKRVVHISDCSNGEETIDLWGDAGCNDLFGRYRSGTLKEAVIAICREEVRQLYYDFEVLLETAEKLPDGSARKSRIFKTLYDVTLSLHELGAQSVAEARQTLGKQLAMKGGDPVLTVSAIGHAHIDLAWLWPIRETIRKGARTFSTALRMMERYPDYIFGASQPQLYDWMKQHYPKLYDRVKERIREGRWEPQGAMWVESDTNVPGGEALVRQVLYGKRFFQQEFGMEMKSLWMPDVFGYSASLPQILKLSGVDYMMTQKLSWSMYNKHPHHTFMWEGIDGSRVLTHMPPEDTYNSPAAPRSIIKLETDYLDKNISEHALMLFGIGDGGGGPGEEHLERLSREKNLLGLSPVVQEPSHVFFEKLSEDADRYPSWRGELYLEKHQGTLTSQARSKRYNRKLEKALRELEYAAVLAATPAAGDDRFVLPYPTEDLEEIWKEVLLYQFHDILPGSSIKRVYDESLERYEILLNRVEQLIAQRYDALASRMTVKKDDSGNQIAVFNSLPWERNEWHRTEEGQWLHVRVPAMGNSVISVLPSSVYDSSAASPESSSVRHLDNDLLTVAFAEDGTIRSIYDKELRREIVAKGEFANDLRIYNDQGDAWDFRHDYRQMTGAKPGLVEATFFQDGPQTGVVHVYRYGQSTLVQKVVLTQGSRRIDFVTKADWRESEKMLRTSFPVDIRTDAAACEIQFGYLKRPTHRNTMWDYAKDEICAHHWIDLSEPDYGVALLNDCKYGHRAEGHVLDLNLLRSPNYPDPEADRAEHEFTYSLYPHAGDHVQAEVYKRGYELNVPLRTVDIRRDAEVPAEVSAQESVPPAFSLDHPHIMIEAIKKAEDNGDIIVRLYETAGAKASAAVHTSLPVSEVWLTDLMENKRDRIDKLDGKVQLGFKPFEIRTLRFSLKK
ncbi:alpha-mannosidase [Paenibacillus sp. GCM10012307]|uniref:Alpha-mannosidase n=1 Tax=Paenibacillus roseus TaxID=2798579 RepID=A0A934IYA8_9BACL|nr:glycoside hydrolase family 38 C-terminal domain-containing protein [Paenibacillus roseus]MBJ6359924.1 alpha-mannosidase [Paenibacillus roseus]